MKPESCPPGPRELGATNTFKNAKACKACMRESCARKLRREAQRPAGQPATRVRAWRTRCATTSRPAPTRFPAARTRQAAAWICPHGRGSSARRSGRTRTTAREASSSARRRGRRRGLAHRRSARRWSALLAAGCAGDSSRVARVPREAHTHLYRACAAAAAAASGAACSRRLPPSHASGSGSGP